MADAEQVKTELFQKLRSAGPEGLSEREALALLLSYPLPRRNPLEAADALLDRYGSLSGVFLAPVEELAHTGALGENGAFLLKLIPQVYRRVRISASSRKRTLSTAEDYGEYFSGLFAAQSNEILYELCLDDRHQVLTCAKISEGDSERVSVSRRRIIETAIQCNASIAVLAHNHPGGDPTPSPEDLALTGQVAQSLRATGVYLEDHIIVSDDAFLSLRQAGHLSREG